MTVATLRSVPSRCVPGLLLLALLASCGRSEPEDGHDEGHTSHAGEAGHDEHRGEVTLTPAEMEAAGIRTTSAGPSALTVSFQLTAAVVPNLDTQVHVNPKVSGIVRAIHVKLGEMVERGAPLCEIDSVDLGNAVADFLKARAVQQAAEDTLSRGQTLYERRVEIQKKVLDGAVAVAQNIFEREEDLKERELTTLRPFLEAEKELKQAQFDRERSMTTLLAERDTRLMELSVAVRTARVELQSAENRLHILGMEHKQVAALQDEQGTNLGRYVVTAPFAGIITRRDATLNEFADTGTELFRIDNLSRAWIAASVYEEDLSAVHGSQAARVVLNAFPSRVFDGRVTYVSHEIDAATRAAHVRIEVDNEPIPEWRERFPIRPGMFGSAELMTGTFEAGVTVPVEAIVRDGSREFVFVEEEDRTFAAKSVKIGRRSPDRVEIVEGLDAGAKVAVSGTFELKSLLQKEKLGGEHSH